MNNGSAVACVYVWVWIWSGRNFLHV